MAITLNQNEIYAALSNMIISQEVFGDPLGGLSSSLVDRARVDGGLYGDTKLYVSTDALRSYPWGNDAETANLLKTYRAPAPATQKITLDVFRQIPVTVDEYLSKRAFADEGTFSSFNGVVLGWLQGGKKIYDVGTYQCFLGTDETTVGKQTLSVTLPARVVDGTAEGEASNRMRAMLIGEALANLAVDLKDYSRDFNDNGFMRSFDPSELMIVWNSAYVNEIRKIDLPTIFNKEGIVEKLDETLMPARFFGTLHKQAKAGDGKARSMIEQDIGSNHYLPGDVIKSGDTAPEGTSYTPNKKIICKLVHKRAVPYMSAFEVGTSFYNPKALNTNHYLTWGHNTLQHIKEFPLITVKEA